ncbi:MAG TPA: RluA family pseudouridine synthase [Fibrobacteres bacterium]|nr:RluA family pseudouridine synthase [Fibrobacterota bacterium]
MNNPDEKITLSVLPENAGVRLDVFITNNLHGFSRSKIQRLMASASILVNGHGIKKNVRCVAGDTIVINERSLDDLSQTVPLAQNIPLEILFEDGYIMAVNKPAGMVVHPGNGNRDCTLVNALLYHGGELSHGFENDRPGIVHRLDKDTSGVLLVAKTDAMHNALARMFAERTVNKYYVGLCSGIVAENHGIIDLPLGRNRREPIKRSVRTGGKNAVTEYRLLSNSHGISILRFSPHTGRTHQIRVHCQSRGFPIVQDRLYGGDMERVEKIPVLERPLAYKVFKCFERHALHAHCIMFAHPATGRSMRIVAPFPEDFRNAFAVLNFNGDTLEGV